MSAMLFAMLITTVAMVVWWGRRIPLAGRRKWLALGCRAAAVSVVCVALMGITRRRTDAIPRRLVYLVDGSASLDAAQREWAARRIASLESIRPRAVERAVVAFGGDQRLIVPFGREPLADPAAIRQALEQADVTRSRTNLEAALLSVPGLLPPRRPGTVVLLSDGRETAGHVAGVLAAARRLGLDVFPAPPPLFGETKTVWEMLAVPPTAQRGSPVAMQLVVFNGDSRAKTGQVTVALQGVTITRRRVAVRPGWQVISVAAPALGLGTMALDVELAVPEERLAQRRSAYTEVEGPPHILFVGERLATLPALAAALKRRDVEVSLAHPAELASDPGRLLDLEAVVLFNIPKSSLSAGQARALRAYVEEYGGGVMMVGLGGDLAREIETPSPLDELLPVQFEPKGLQEAKRRVCVILLIDRSASMQGPRIAATKRAAVALVKQLSPEDLVGILAFDTQPYVISEVGPAGQIGASLVEKLVKLRSSGGTDVYPALAASANRLDLTGATLKHIILLSDGNTPVNRPAYEALFKSFRLSGTTISTIGIGATFINSDYLEWLARSTGGAYYQMRSLEELPQLVARDTQRQMGRLPFTEGRFRPAKTPMTDWFPDTDNWPTLRGYLTATAKPGARVDLVVNGGGGDDPLLARWPLGLGRVVSFTADADTRWSPDWIRWPGFEGAWAQVLRWAMRPRLTEELFAWVDESGSIPQLVVEGRLRDPQGELVAADGTATLPMALIQTGPWRWRASLEAVPGGWYQLALTLRTPDAETPMFAKRWVQVDTPPAAQEITGQPSHAALLRQIARVTSGAYDEPDQALLPPTVSWPVEEPMTLWWLPLVIVLLLIDVALRGPSML